MIGETYARFTSEPQSTSEAPKPTTAGSADPCAAGASSSSRGRPSTELPLPKENRSAINEGRLSTVRATTCQSGR